MLVRPEGRSTVRQGTTPQRRAGVQTVKMVISGAVNAGKTEFIRAISEIEVVSTERRATD